MVGYPFLARAAVSAGAPACAPPRYRILKQESCAGAVGCFLRGAIAIEVVHGDHSFNGKTTVHTTSIPNSLALHDGQVVGSMTDDDELSSLCGPPYPSMSLLKKIIYRDFF